MFGHFLTLCMKRLNQVNRSNNITICQIKLTLSWFFLFWLYVYVVEKIILKNCKIFKENINKLDNLDFFN